MANAQLQHAGYDFVLILTRIGHEWAEAHEGRDCVGLRIHALRSRPRQVAFGEDADQPASFRNRQSADVRLSHPARRLAQGFGEVGREDLLSREITKSHGAPVLSAQIEAISITSRVGETRVKTRRHGKPWTPRPHCCTASKFWIRRASRRSWKPGWHADGAAYEVSRQSAGGPGAHHSSPRG